MKMKTVNLIAGVCLLVVTLIEVFERRPNLSSKIEHGLLIYALAHVINCTIEFIEGIQKINAFRNVGE